MRKGDSMSWQTLSDTEPKARKSYRCIWCGEMIDTGEKHRHQVGRMEGGFQDNRYHTECFEAALQTWREDPDAGFEAYSFKRGTTEEHGS